MTMIRVILSSFLVLTFFSLNSFAIDFDINAGQTITLTDIVGGTDELDFIASEGRCYCCELVEHTGVNTRFGEVKVFGNGSPTVSVTNRGAAEPIIKDTGSDPQNESRKCFTVSSSDKQDKFRVTMEILVGGSGTSTITDGNLTVSCKETTLLGGFNTSVTDFNFIELTNSLQSNEDDDGVITGTLIAQNAITDTEIINTSFSVNPKDRVDFDVHSAAGTGAFGTVFVCHDGPPNSLKAVTSQYRIVTQSPLDFEPVAQTVFEPIGGN
jgi:hypothetical protein